MKYSRSLRLMFAVLVAGFWPLWSFAQSPVLLNINSSTYATLCTAANYQALGVHGLSGSEPVSQFSPAFNVGLTSPLTFTSGGQVIYLSDTANGGTWVKPTGAGSTNGLMDCYFYTTTTTPRTLTVSNLNLTPGTSYTLYLIGAIPVDNGAEEGRFQPVNTPNITFTSTAVSHGAVGFPFATSAAYSNANTLQFTWAKYSSGNGAFQGLAIVPGQPSPTLSLTITNGVQKYTTLANTTVTMSGHCELWVTSAAAPITGCSINLTSADSWLFLPNVKPSIAVQPIYLGQVRINGAAAVADSNCRVVQYGQNGAVIIPQASTFQPLTVYTQPQFGGTATSYSQWTRYTGSGISNIRSFKLKRGYQAVFAQDINGANYSKCYVAQDGDLEIGVLPSTLDNQVQFIYVTPWRWVPKKAIAGDPGLVQLNLGSWYNWNIDQNSTRDLEYVAIRQQRWWPDLAGQDWKTRGINTVLGYNEPDNTSQANLAVGDAIWSWPDLLWTGLRVGSPATTDGGRSSWLYPFIQQADAAGLRVDFVAVHYYWCYSPTSPSGAASQMYSFLLDIYNNTHRPIWITEWNNGANWTGCADPDYAQQQACVSAMIDMLESTPFVERYQLYNWVEDVRGVTTNGVLTPAGVTYRDKVSNLSYKQALPDNGTRGVAQYLFANNSQDSSGNYNNAMAAGSPAYVTGHNAQASAIVLDGTNSYVQLPVNIARSNAFTFAAWVNWSGVGGNWQRIFDFGNDTSQYLFLTPNSGSGLRFAIKNGGSEQIVERTGALASGSWQHVAVTLNGSTGILYLNGVQVASAAITIKPSDFSPIYNYLGKSQWPDPLFNGKLEDVEIVDYAMSAAQIQALYNNVITDFNGVWTSNASGNWGDVNNWSGGVIATGAGRLADFSTIDITADRTVTLDSARTIGELRFGDTSGAQNWTLAGGNTLTLDGGGGSAVTIAVNQNTATISAPLAGSSGFTKTGTGTLKLSGTGNDLGGTMSVSAGVVSITGGSDDVANVHVATVSSGSLTGTINITGGGVLNSGAETVVYDGQNAGVSGSGTLNVNSGVLNSENDFQLAFAGSGTGTVNITSAGTVNVATTTKRWVVMNVWDTTKAKLNINGGTLNLNADSDIQFSTGWYAPGASVGQSAVTLNSGAIVGGSGSVINLNNDSDGTGGSGACDNSLNLNGGTLTIGQIVSGMTTGSRTVNFNGGTLKAAATSTSFFASGAASIANVRNGGVVIDSNGKDITISQALAHSTIGGDNATDGGLTKNGMGKLTLIGASTYTGDTLIGEGTLALGTGGSINSSPNIVVSNGATFDVSAISYSLASGKTLKGNGSITGNVTINSGATLSPGLSVGRLVCNNNLTLAGTTLMELDKSQGTNDSVTVVGTLTYGGTLTVTNVGGTLAAGDNFQLFNATSPSGAFGATNLPALDTGLAWNFSPSSGLLSVVQTVSTGQVDVVCTFADGLLSLGWPADHTGWQLQVQTNGLDSNGWYGVPSSSTTNFMTIPVADGGPTSVFYRLVYP